MGKKIENGILGGGNDFPYSKERAPKVDKTNRHVPVWKKVLKRPMRRTAMFLLFTSIALTFSREPTMRIIDSVKSSVADAYHTYINPTKPQEIVDLMTEFYELLADMGYYERSIIYQPPPQPLHKPNPSSRAWIFQTRRRND
jgi:hypothetical protein